MISVEEVYFEDAELIRAMSIETGEYEAFMMLSTECPKRLGDFLSVEMIYVGDHGPDEEKVLTEDDFADGAIASTVSSEFIEKTTQDIKRSVKGNDNLDEGYIYICRRADDDFGIGFCTSPDPLKKASLEDWENL